MVHTAFGAGWSNLMLSSLVGATPNELIESAKPHAGSLKTSTTVALPFAILPPPHLFALSIRCHVRGPFAGAVEE